MMEEDLTPLKAPILPEPLAAMQAFLKHNSDFEALLEEIALTETQSLPQLNITLSSDLELQILFASDVIAAMGLETKTSHAVILQFYVPFPSLIPEEHHHAIYQALNEYNQLLPFGTLGMSEQHLIYFRYCLMLRDRQPEGPFFLALVKQISALMVVLEPLMTQLSTYPERLPETTLLTQCYPLNKPLRLTQPDVVLTKEHKEYLPPTMPYWFTGALSASLTLWLGQQIGWVNAALFSTVLITTSAYVLSLHRLKKQNQQQLRLDYQKHHSKLKAIKSTQKRLSHKQDRLQQHLLDVTSMIAILNENPLVSPQQIWQTRSNILSLRTLESYIHEQAQQVESQKNRSTRTENQLNERLEQLKHKLNQQDEVGALKMLQQRTAQLLNSGKSEPEQSLLDLQVILEQLGFTVMFNSATEPKSLAVFFPKPQIHTQQGMYIALARIPQTSVLYELTITANFKLPIASNKHRDLAPLLNLFNRLTPIGTFALEKNILTYHYNLYQCDWYTDIALVVELLDFIYYFAKQFVPLLLAVAKGEQNLDSMLNNILQS